MGRRQGTLGYASRRRLSAAVMTHRHRIGMDQTGMNRREKRGGVGPRYPSSAWQRRYHELMAFVPPMLATRLEDPRRLAEPRYIAEPKLDGQRAQVHIRHGRTVDAFRRPGRELIRLPGLAWLCEIRWPVASAILDSCGRDTKGRRGVHPSPAFRFLPLLLHHAEQHGATIRNS